MHSHDDDDSDIHSTQANRNYKDSLFRRLFGSEKHKDWTLSLFNAINGTDYKDPDEIQFRYSDDLLYISRKEDVIFVFHDTFQFYEHQSTWSPNIPYRMMQYTAKHMADVVRKTRQSEFSSRKMKLPKPVYCVLYNGRKNAPAKSELLLSDLYVSKKDDESLGNGFSLDAVVTVLNINSGYNEAVQEGCKPLAEYAWLISSIRNEQENGSDLRSAIETVLQRVPDNFLIYEELMAESGRVIDMLFDELDNRMHIEFYGDERFEEGKLEGLQEGKLEGKQEGKLDQKKSTIRNMLEDHCDPEMIVKYTDASMELIDEVRTELQRCQ